MWFMVAQRIGAVSAPTRISSQPRQGEHRNFRRQGNQGGIIIANRDVRVLRAGGQ